MQDEYRKTFDLIVTPLKEPEAQAWKLNTFNTLYDQFFVTHS
jgi:hypothetical protein